MAAKKFLTLLLGQIVEIAGLQTSAGAEDAGKIPALGDDGRISETMMPTGIGADTKTAVASESLSAGDYVNLYNDTGTIKARKADCSNGRRAHGFVKAAVDSAATATVYLEGTNSNHTSLTPGAIMYLSTGGAVSATAPTTTGYISQEIGYSLSDTEVSFEAQQPITLA